LCDPAADVPAFDDIRGFDSTGHGRGGTARSLTSHLARLADDAALGLVAFAFQTHIENPPEA
jgi:hypothetical protein